jgi:hypothetical protein
MKIKTTFIQFALALALLVLGVSCAGPMGPRYGRPGNGYGSYYGQPMSGECMIGQGDGEYAGRHYVQTDPRAYGARRSYYGNGGNCASQGTAVRSGTRRVIEHGQQGRWMIHHNENGEVDQKIWVPGGDDPDTFRGEPVHHHEHTRMTVGELDALLSKHGANSN